MPPLIKCLNILNINLKQDENLSPGLHYVHLLVYVDEQDQSDLKIREDLHYTLVVPVPTAIK